MRTWGAQQAAQRGKGDVGTDLQEVPLHLEGVGLRRSGLLYPRAEPAEGKGPITPEGELVDVPDLIVDDRITSHEDPEP